MKYLFIFILSISTVQGQNCRGPMNPRAFNSEVDLLRRLPQEATRFRTAMETFGPFCLSSAQVYQVCRILGQDPYRIDFAFASYQKVLDPENFYDVYDALQLFSSAFRLHDLVMGNMTVEVVTIPAPVPTEAAPLPEPVCEVTAQEMAEIKDLVKAATFKGSMENQAKMMVKSKQCFRSDQIVDLLSVFTYDDSKLMLAKYAFDYCIDTQNYYRAVNALTFKSGQDDLTRFIESRN